MRLANLQGASRRKKKKTTTREKDARPASDLVDCHLSASGPNQFWVAELTFILTGEGFLYLAVVIDAFGRRAVGWSMQNHLRTECVLAPLETALARRRPGGVIHHSEQGSQHTSVTFGKHCRKAGVRPSMGSVGDCYDNALCESFFATLECELLARERFATRVEARTAVFDFIEGSYNTHLRHSSLGYLSPLAFETRHHLIIKSSNA